MAPRNSRKLFVTTPSDREIVLTRTFDAPRALVFQAWTKPEHVRRWYGCAEFELVVCDIDLRVGGQYRYTTCAPDGVHHTMTGIYRDIAPPARIVHTERYETTGFISEDAIVTTIFEERDGGTTLTTTVLHRSRENRDGHLNSGMERGASETFDRLADLLANMTVA